MSALVRSPAPAQSCVGEVLAFYPLTAPHAGSPQAPYLTRSAAAAAHHGTPKSPALLISAAPADAAAPAKRAHCPTPGSGHSVKRTKRSSPVYMRGVLQPRTLQFNPESPASPLPPRGQPAEWIFDAVPLIQGTREAEFHMAEYQIPVPFGSVLSILPFCDTTAD